jgi:hypothetical protein
MSEEKNAVKCQEPGDHYHDCTKCEHFLCSVYDEPCHSCREEENNFECNFVEKKGEKRKWLKLN